MTDYMRDPNGLRADKFAEFEASPIGDESMRQMQEVIDRDIEHVANLYAYAFPAHFVVDEDGTIYARIKTKPGTLPKDDALWWYNALPTRGVE